MTREFKIVDAAFWGFGIVKRDMSTFIGVVLLSIGMVVLFPLLAGPAYFQYFQALTNNPSEAELAQAGLSLFAGASLYFLITFIAGFVIMAAIVRSNALGQSKAWVLGLQLGWDELRVFVVYLVTYILIMLALYIPMIVFGIGGGLAGAAIGSDGGAIVAAIVIGLGVILGIAAFLVVSVRLSAGMAFAVGEKSLGAFIRSWGATKGYFWKIFLAFLLLILVFIALYVVVAIIMGVLAALGAAAAFDVEAMQNVETFDEFIAALNLPVTIVFGSIFGVLLAAVGAIFYSAWLGVGAYVYRQLSGSFTEDGEAVAETF